MGTYIPNLYPRPGEELPGQVLVRTCVNSSQNNQIGTPQIKYEWRSKTFRDVLVELKETTSESRVFFVEGSARRSLRSQASGDARMNLNDTNTEVFRLFSRTPECRQYMRETLGFPDYLFHDTWNASNGFGGLSRLLASPSSNISWFRVLVKAIGTSKETWKQRKYYWYEMTYLIHQVEGEDHFTAVCFDVPEDANDGAEISKKSREINFVSQLHHILSEFESHAPDPKPDWRYIQSALLQLSVVVADRGVWACSDAVREVERSRHILSFDFPEAHDLLRHTQHSTEVLGVATKTISMWLEQYHLAQKWQQTQNSASQPTSGSSPGHTTPPIPPTSGQTPPSRPSSYTTAPGNIPSANSNANHGDTPLSKATHYADLVASLQLLDNLTQRSASNDARLRNEINLAFNQVNQRDAAAMRTISVITLLFLPATFVSTLFSMTFFNFQRDSAQGWGVSKWIWLYPVIAVPLTLIAGVLWYAKEIVRFWKRYILKEKTD